MSSRAGMTHWRSLGTAAAVPGAAVIGAGQALLNQARDML